jgi:hypothetical protein
MQTRVTRRCKVIVGVLAMIDAGVSSNCVGGGSERRRDVFIGNSRSCCELHLRLSSFY